MENERMARLGLQNRCSTTELTRHSGTLCTSENKLLPMPPRRNVLNPFRTRQVFAPRLRRLKRPRANHEMAIYRHLKATNHGQVRVGTLELRRCLCSSQSLPRRSFPRNYLGGRAADFLSRASFCASAICAGVMRRAIRSRKAAAPSLPWAADKSNHI
jgi:hypothetical protein